MGGALGIFPAGPAMLSKLISFVGAVLSVTAAVLALAFDARGAAYVLLGMLVIAASLEAFLAFCLGCQIFGALMRLGVIPEEICERCNNLSAVEPSTATVPSRHVEQEAARR